MPTAPAIVPDDTTGVAVAAAAAAALASLGAFAADADAAADVDVGAGAGTDSLWSAASAIAASCDELARGRWPNILTSLGDPALTYVIGTESRSLVALTKPRISGLCAVDRETMPHECRSADNDAQNRVPATLGGDQFAGKVTTLDDDGVGALLSSPVNKRRRQTRNASHQTTHDFADDLLERELRILVVDKLEKDGNHFGVGVRRKRVAVLDL